MTTKYDELWTLESFLERTWDLHLRNERFHIQSLRRAFSEVQDRSNWKNPIAWIIEGKDQHLVEEAIIFFTGSVPTFVKAEGNTGRLVVKAEGYYNAIGA